MNFEYLLARTELIFGKGMLKNIGDKVSKIGKKSLLVTGKRSMSRLGFLDKTKDVLKKAGVADNFKQISMRRKQDECSTHNH